MKRAVDIVFGSVAILLFAPVFLLLAVLVAISMGRPIVFKQWRAGLDGKPFQMYKFRTMKDGAGSDVDRMTKVGSRLRSWSLDELPELFNVVKGDMSLVGPRPLHLYYLGRYTPRQARRHEARPGVTGLAQVSGRNAITWSERFELDVVYVEQASLRLDLRILFDTVRTVVTREGISGEDSATMAEFAGRFEENDLARRTADLSAEARMIMAEKADGKVSPLVTDPDQMIDDMEATSELPSSSGVADSPRPRWDQEATDRFPAPSPGFK